MRNVQIQQSICRKTVHQTKYLTLRDNTRLTTHRIDHIQTSRSKQTTHLHLTLHKHTEIIIHRQQLHNLQQIILTLNITRPLRTLLTVTVKSNTLQLSYTETTSNAKILIVLNQPRNAENHRTALEQRHQKHKQQIIVRKRTVNVLTDLRQLFKIHLTRLSNLLHR